MSGYNKSLSKAMQSRVEMDRLQHNPNNRSYATTSLCQCTVTNPFREKVIQIVLNPWFDRFILFVIFANCIILAIEDPNKEKTTLDTALDYTFLIIFTIEMCLKIIAMGFFLKPYSYLRDPWNVLDFLVVVIGWATQELDESNISAIRSLRILRPLRTINSMPGMGGLVKTLLSSLPTMLNILVLFLFNLIIFSTIGMQLFGGHFHNRCVLTSTISEDWSQEEYLTNDVGDSLFCTITENEEVSNEWMCPQEYQCLERSNPNGGLTNYDNIIWAMLTTFELITLEGWTDVMYTVRRSERTSIFDIYFVLCVICGAFFVLNLMIAV